MHFNMKFPEWSGVHSVREREIWHRAILAVDMVYIHATPACPWFRDRSHACGQSGTPSRGELWPREPLPTAFRRLHQRMNDRMSASFRNGCRASQFRVFTPLYRDPGNQLCMHLHTGRGLHRGALA